MNKVTKSDKTRHLIIEKAAELFNQKGYHGTSMSDIMEATGLTKGGIYGNFKKDGKDKKGVKDEIAIAAFEHAVKKVTYQVGERTRVIDNTIDKLKTVVYFYKERVLNPPVEGGCPIQNTSIEADDNNPILKKNVTNALKHWQDRILYTIQKGKERGEIREEVDGDEFAIQFIGIIEGGIMISRIFNEVEPFNKMADLLLSLIEDLKK
ncbi:MAG: TetR/AcrR family transcriptional regulator [Bacteroidetes bacterium]|jgi:AcrR family transcriptional regulator|nr:TetR/AcrR family transcriptional regulator [Bacteroidota bacterium]MDF1867170.1 TetR/AcrR family transcriptional regulator [Saprospiraceae bacterium]